MLLIILLLLLVFALPTWPYSAGWGYYPSGLLGLLLIVLFVLLAGRPSRRAVTALNSSFAPLGLTSASNSIPPGSRPGLHSCAAPRLRRTRELHLRLNKREPALSAAKEGLHPGSSGSRQRNQSPADYRPLSPDSSSSTAFPRYLI